MITWMLLACADGEGDGEPTSPERTLAGPFTGARLVVDADSLWVGSPGGGTSGDPGRWSRLVAPVGGAALAEAARVIAGASGDAAGGLAVCSDGTVLIGAPERNGRGGAWVLGPGDDALGDQAFVEGLYDDGRAGVALGCGELTGADGPDFVVSAPESDTTLPGAGTLGVYALGDDGTDKIANVDTTWAGAALGDHTALLVRDVNGDGTDDVVVAGPGSDRVHFVLGPVRGASFTNTTPTLQGTDGESTGASLALGDFTGDGVLDLVIGTPAGAFGTGGLWLQPGPLLEAAGLLRNSAHFIRGISEGAELGYAVSMVGDVDGDGADDLLVGAPGAPGEGPDAGAAYLILGPSLSTLLDVDAADATLLPSAPRGRFGAAVAGGDLDGDGVFELYVGAPEATVGGTTGVGEVVVFPATVRGTVYDTDGGAPIR